MPVQDKTYRLRALLILFVFGISLMPRQVLHNFVTNHKHIKWAGLPGKAQLSPETFSCSVDNLFLQQTFNTTNQSFTPDCPGSERSANESLIAFSRNDRQGFISLRGPPANS